MCDIPTWNHRYLGVGRTNRPNKNKQTKKISLDSCLRKCEWREKSSPERPQIYFLNRFSADSLFSFRVSFAFFILVFFCLFVCCFLKLKYIFWYTFGYAGGWMIKKFSPRRFPETRLLFLALVVVDGNNLHC